MHIEKLETKIMGDEVAIHTLGKEPKKYLIQVDSVKETKKDDIFETITETKCERRWCNCMFKIYQMIVFAIYNHITHGVEPIYRHPEDGWPEFGDRYDKLFEFIYASITDRVSEVINPEFDRYSKDMWLIDFDLKHNTIYLKNKCHPKDGNVEIKVHFDFITDAVDDWDYDEDE